MIDYQETDRERAVRDVAALVRNPLAAMSVPDRENALALARHFRITAEDLIDATVAQARAR